MNQPRITPTVGRVVHFYDTQRHPGFHQTDGFGPYAALIAHVSDPDHVNLTVSDANGTTHGFIGVPLSHDGGQPEGAKHWCEWMPYQKGQAAKTEAVEKELREVSGTSRPRLVLPVVDAGAGPLERQIQALGLTEPRVTPADIEAEITHEFYFSPIRAMEGDDAREIWRAGDGGAPGEAPLPEALRLLTFCVLILRNGTKVVGINYGAIDPAQHSAEVGRAEARKEAVNKVYELLGFRLRDKLAATPPDLQALAAHAGFKLLAEPMTGEKLVERRTNFDDLVHHGLAQCMAEGRESNIINGMPWSFTYKGLYVTHENDNCYLVGELRFERGQVLVTGPGELARVVSGTVAS